MKSESFITSLINVSSVPVQTQLHSQFSCVTKMETVILVSVFHHVVHRFPRPRHLCICSPSLFPLSRSTRAVINPDPWETNKRKPPQIHQLKWKAIYPEQELTPLLPDEWSWSLVPKEAATRKTFDNAAFMGAQHKGTLSTEAGPCPGALICGPGSSRRGLASVTAGAGWVPVLCIGGVSFQFSDKRCYESLSDHSSFEEFSLKECPRILKIRIYF